MMLEPADIWFELFLCILGHGKASRAEGNPKKISDFFKVSIIVYNTCSSVISQCVVVLYTVRLKLYDYTHR